MRINTSPTLSSTPRPTALPILAILSTLKAGGAFLPLDPDDLTLQKEMFIADTNTKILLSSYLPCHDYDKALALKVIVAYIKNAMFEKRLLKFDDSNSEVPGHTPANLAYIMFTSGSTGKPKGVMIKHHSIANLVQNSPIWLPPGATLVTGHKELVLGDIGKAIKPLHINVIHCTPSILTVVPLDNYLTLETVVVAGETLGKKLIKVHEHVWSY
ncbi:acetyl-CoA synthetase-like protein [Thelephora ganbajun]|uniref:Acetyl-CoA synthetase-like protein n=1 Tax=Thelephora ganbajun TaxID=370292 RepID=A0ACB6Z080_THEGA|nr:acetyl-CoA synthetase-like protein [Thelephora ganbajun]